jgi:hypothetical protein
VAVILELLKYEAMAQKKGTNGPIIITHHPAPAKLQGGGL